MSYDPRLTGAPGGDDEQGARKGSVRAARQRLQAAQMRTQLPDTSKVIGLPMSQYSIQQNRYDPSSQSRSLERRGNGSLASPPPQWPLSNHGDEASFPPVPPLRSPRRLQPPEQIIRPVSDDFPIQQPSPDYPPPTFPNYPQTASPDYEMGYRSDETLSPYSSRNSRPLTTSSGVSAGSSLGSIPDFPVPQPPMALVQQARRTPSLGPPPSSRRGPSSYYTQMSYVSPIVEESETRSNTVPSRHGSFASSNVFPMNDDYYRDEIFSDDDDETITSDRGTITPTMGDDQRRLVELQPTLVRQASIGKRTKPALMTIKSGDSYVNRDGAEKPVAEPATVRVIGGAGAIAETSPRRSPLGYGTGLMDPSSSSSESVNTINNLRSKVTGYASPKSPDSVFSQEVRPKTLADRVGMRRPPRLDVGAVRDAEARGSLTSLPDLIRRATRLAANLDRGKTASRLGLEFWEAGAVDEQNTRQSGMTDMLAAFPPPGQDTPLRSATGTPNTATPNPVNNLSNWPSHSPGLRSGVTDSALDKQRPRQRRKCCGMPLWQFIALLIFLLLVVATAVLLPVVLIVIPNQQKSTTAAAQGSTSTNISSSSSTTTSLLPVPTASPGSDNCGDLINCQNGGVAILNADRTCNCVCANGFTGQTCTNNDSAGCTTMNIGSVSNRATIGSGLPRLISASSNFNIPLNTTLLLGLFSDLSLSCAAENALITFNGLLARSSPQSFHSVNLKHIPQPTRSYPILDYPHLARSDDKAEERRGAPVSNAQQTASPQQAIPISSNATALDFARASVLLALQVTGTLDTAANAQQTIQNFLTNNRNGQAAGTTTIDVKVFTLDLSSLTLRFKNGTKVHADPVSTPSATAS